MSVFIGALVMIFLTEMGDKSQLMAFSLASRYRARTILLGVFFATLINNGVAVFLGTALGEVLPLEMVTLFSSIVFLLFGAWTLLEEREDTTEVPASRNLGSFLSVVSLFFIAEMGDKTQIASAAYAATYGAPFLTLGGVICGMLLADALGIYVGVRLKSFVSTITLKIISSGVFFFFGGYHLIISPLAPFNITSLLLLFYGLILIVFYWHLRKSAF